MGPGKTWACLSFLSKESLPLGEGVLLGSAGEKRLLACLFYLKEFPELPDAGRATDREIKSPRQKCRGLLVRFQCAVSLLSLKFQ